MFVSKKKHTLVLRALMESRHCQASDLWEKDRLVEEIAALEADLDQYKGTLAAITLNMDVIRALSTPPEIEVISRGATGSEVRVMHTFLKSADLIADLIKKIEETPADVDVNDLAREQAESEGVHPSTSAG